MQTQKLSIRMLRNSVEPDQALRSGAALEEWTTIEGSKISLGRMGGVAPRWATFLTLTAAQREELFNTNAFGLVFIKAANRWFALSFGLGHVKLDPAKFEQDFGLRVVLNAVDPKHLRSADVRTPDENTLSRRSQTSRGSDQTAFAIDTERDIVRGLAGKPKDSKFAAYVAGSDGLTLHKKIEVGDLAKVCADAYGMYQKTDYQASFKWIDQIRHVRDAATLTALRAALVAKVDAAVKADDPDGLQLASPVIYDPEQGHHIQYKGFRSKEVFPDLDITGYFQALKERGKAAFEDADLDRHRVHEVDADGVDQGDAWPIFECLTTEITHDSQSYVLSGGRWYSVDASLAADLQKFFSDTPKLSLPAALAGENEETYNKRLKANDTSLLCLDRKLVRPTGASSDIEVCDFLTLDKKLIHVKDKTSSSRLSHLFSQGTVSGRVLILDTACRDSARARVVEVQGETGQTGFDNVIPASTASFSAPEFTVVYAVITTGKTTTLPFFSLLTFRQAARDLQVAGYKYAFAWIVKPKDVTTKKAAPKKAAAVPAA